MTRDEIRAHVTDPIALLVTLDGECRGEPLLGQVAVASVIRNRLLAGRFGRSIAAVCTAPSQFSCWWDEDGANTARLYVIAQALLAGATPPLPAGDTPVFRQLGWIATGVLAGDVMDPTGHATHYLTRDLYRRSPPKWTAGAPILAEIGQHIFLRVA